MELQISESANQRINGAYPHRLVNLQGIVREMGGLVKGCGVRLPTLFFA
jgi:hypothetical protein